MTSGSNDKRSTRIPIRFLDDETRQGPSTSVNPSDMDRLDPDSDVDSSEEEIDLNQILDGPTGDLTPEGGGGPATAELVATRAELKRVQEENAELRDRLA